MSFFHLLVGGLSFLAAALAATRYLGFARRSRIPSGREAGLADAVFLFEGPDLVDATPRAEHLLARADRRASDWAQAMGALSPYFPGLDPGLSNLAPGETRTFASRGGDARIVATAVGDRVKLALRHGDGTGPASGIDPIVHDALEKEAEDLRAMAEHLPYLIWRQAADGTVIWANNAYREATAELSGRAEYDDGRPLVLFSSDAMAQIAQDGGVRRQVLRPEDGDDMWFECRAVPMPGTTLFAATRINATVQAEQQLRNFMQTLTKTFSHLTTGLAIFDSQRRLSLFNPALTDLTGLPVDFLAARPSLYSVLDRLRDRRMIPEPKDYPTWRKQISALEAAAVSGTFSDTWALPDGRTYRVSGRPHPGGALAFVIEDISAEMSLTRRFRSELELGQAVVDAMEDAIVVFSASGTVSMVNRAYQELWQDGLADSVDMPAVTEVSRIWMARAKATPLWGEIRDFVSHERDRSSWRDEATLVNGDRLSVRVVPLSGGSTLVAFRPEPAIPGDASMQRTA